MQPITAGEKQLYHLHLNFFLPSNADIYSFVLLP